MKILFVFLFLFFVLAQIFRILWCVLYTVAVFLRLDLTKIALYRIVTLYPDMYRVARLLPRHSPEVK